MSFLERYKNGEHEKVWEELMALGPEVREEPYYLDAKAVAQETMARAHQNIEMLITRLIHLGFVFGYDHLLRGILTSKSTGDKYFAYEKMLSWIREQPPVFLDAHLENRRTAFDEFAPFLPDWDEKLEAFEREVRSYPLPFLERVEQEIGPIPLSIHAWYTEIETVNFYGYFAPWNQLVRSFYPELYKTRPHFATSLMEHCDPLQIRALDASALAEMKTQKEKQERKRVNFEYAPDCFEKDFTSGGGGTNYSFSFPDSGVDAKTYKSTFVQYLRSSLLQWAGFPGMAEWPVKPEKDLALLTKGLIPF
jgi:hypothetical protein